MVLTIRSEAPGDAAGIRAVHLAAFDTPAEADLVERIRNSERYRPAFSILAVDDGEVVGHALLSYAELHHRDIARPVLVLAPLAVAPQRQHRGVGTALMHECIGRADHAGEPLIVLTGHPDYYPRFGFRPASRYGITPPEALPDEVFLARPLTGYQETFRGELRYPPAFDGVLADLADPPAPA